MSLDKLNQYISWDALNITRTDIAEIIILSFIIYQVMIWIKSTRASGSCTAFPYEYDIMDF